MVQAEDTNTQPELVAATVEAEETTVEQNTDEVVDDSFELNVILPGGSQTQVLVNPQETIRDVRQALVESPETCIYSCFYLSLEGQKLNDFVTLAEVEGLSPESQLTLVEDVYTEQEARIHLIRLKDLLAGPIKSNAFAVGVDSAIPLFTAISGDDLDVKEENEKEVADPKEQTPVEHVFSKYPMNSRFPLSQFFPADFQRSPIRCLKNLSFSGWNPVPHYRKMKGDLMYLTVTTLENEVVNITSSVSGFYVSKSTVQSFDPNPRVGAKSFESHSLITLLQKLSPLFTQKFKELQEFITRHQVLEILPVPSSITSHPWCVKPTAHTSDLCRIAEPYLNFGTDAADSFRDWNEEIQSHRELPRTNLQERVFRDRLLNKVNSDFAEAAIKGAISIVDGNVVPVNPLDPSESHMYIHNNIFFSKGFDGRGAFEKLGGDEAAHVAAGKDIEGARALNGVDVENLHSLGSAVVDYKGIRIVAQSIVSGIFRRQDDNSIIYGSVDNGVTVAAEEKFHELVGQLAKALHIDEHTVLNEKGEKKDLFTSLETKGLLGDDGRRYLLDLYRINPVDIEFQQQECCSPKQEEDLPAYPHKMTLLRPELVDLYWEHRFRQYIKEKMEAAQKQKSTDSEEGQAEKAVNDETKASEQSDVAVDEPSAETDYEVTAEDVANFKLAFNPDAFTDIKTVTGENGEKDPKLVEQEAAVREASKFLQTIVVPNLVIDLSTYLVSPIDGNALTNIMHKRGINMRYLGRIATLAGSIDNARLVQITDLTVQEMIIRASKRILRNYLRELPQIYVADCISHFFNCLLGVAHNPNPTPSTKTDFAYASLTPAELKTKIYDEIVLRFRYKLAEGYLQSKIKKLPLLREICQRVGIQVHAKDYHFEAMEQSQPKLSKGKPVISTTFIPEDIINIVPIAKEATPKCIFAEEAFEAGKISLAQGQRELGLELLQESLALHEQSYGFLHPETGRCYAALAMIYHHAGDEESAIDFQRKAVIVSERTCGLDNPDTIHNYLNLALFEHANGNTKLALKYIKHALNFWDIIYGPGHPDSTTTDNNIAVMLQTLRDFELSKVFFERARDTHQSILGEDHVLTAGSNHSLAKAYALTGDFKTALSIEKTAFKVFHQNLGPEDPKTMESSQWLQDLTANAVYMAKLKLHEKHFAMQQLREEVTETSALQSHPLDQAVAGSRGHLPIEDLVHYINDDSPAPKKTKKKSQRKMISKTSLRGH
ncbi:Intracellular distribution of mitochondria [Basidiobolus ranarum]|uniref:Clustered mitochondria protein homolog n=1 Tax=Basidiobolus ranarum TaxID=34480 RepID=A0ABR2W6D6_9FUNG